jgi:hypothetical protein
MSAQRCLLSLHLYWADYQEWPSLMIRRNKY